MIDFDISKYREIFMEECEELLAEIDDILLSIEKKKSIDDKEIKDIFRHIHTIKGGAASVEFVYTSKFAHEFESFLDKMRNKEIEFHSDMSDVFIGSGDAIKELIELETTVGLDESSFNAKTKSLLDAFKEFSVKKEVAKESLEPPEEKSFGFFDDSFFIPAPAPKSEVAPKQEQTPIEAPSFEIVVPVFEAVANIEEKQGQKESRNETQKQPQAPSPTIRVDLSKVDALLNNIGELVIDMSMLHQYIENIEDLSVKSALLEKMTVLNRHIRDLQESVMGTRMVPMESIYAKFPKSIRDIAKKLGKSIEFKSFGGSVEIDKAMIEGLNDPLMHIIRNSCDHGIESAEDRVKKGKPTSGLITIGAGEANGQIVISVKDDGKGIDCELVAKKALENGIITKERLASLSQQEKVELIFEAGLSTAKSVTEVSGRGVGMDVVKNNISKLGGSIKIESKKDEGSTFIIFLPLTLAILDGLNIMVGDCKFILPLASIVESLQPDGSMTKTIGDGSEELLLLRDEAIPVIRLHKVFNIEPQYTELTQGMLIIARSIYGKVALFLDMFLNQQQIVIKPIDKNFRAVKGVSGATVRGDGAIGLILDVLGIIELHRESRRAA